MLIKFMHNSIAKTSIVIVAHRIKSQESRIVLLAVMRYVNWCFTYLLTLKICLKMTLMESRVTPLYEEASVVAVS